MSWVFYLAFYDCLLINKLSFVGVAYKPYNIILLFGCLSFKSYVFVIDHLFAAFLRPA